MRIIVLFKHTNRKLINKYSADRVKNCSFQYFDLIHIKEYYNYVNLLLQVLDHYLTYLTVHCNKNPQWGP